MKVQMLKLKEKTYTTGKITTYLSKEALKIQKEALALAQKGREIQADTDNLNEINGLFEDMLELKDRKSWLIREMYGNNFTADELEKELSDEEIDAQINSIISGICGVVQKN